MAISAAAVQALRKASGAGMMDCKRALEEAGGDQEKATEILRKKGTLKAAKRQERETREGLVHSYIHMGGKIGVLIEINCETDFVARSEGFRTLAHELALQIAAASPRYIREEEIPEAILEHEAGIARQRAKEEGKPDNVLEKIVAGRLEKFKDEVVLMRQAYIRDEDLTIEKLVLQTIGSTGENIVIRRFRRWELGEKLDE